VTYQIDPRVDAYIDALPAWQQEICQQVRDLVHSVDPEVVETIKRRVQPYFVLEGNICALLAAKDHVNVFLYDGAIVPDPEGIITGGHDNQTARTVAIRQDEKINTHALGEMFRQIIANNRAGGWRKIKQEQLAPRGLTASEHRRDSATSVATRRGKPLRREQGAAHPATRTSPLQQRHAHGRPGSHCHRIR
jgi:hypothetical protein